MQTIVPTIVSISDAMKRAGATEDSMKMAMYGIKTYKAGSHNGASSMDKSNRLATGIILLLVQHETPFPEKTRELLYQELFSYFSTPNSLEGEDGHEDLAEMAGAITDEGSF